MDIASLQRRIEDLNAKILPIAKKPVAFGPDLVDRARALPKPLDEAGVRGEAEQALLDSIDLYLQCTADERDRLRDIFRKNHAFAWAATLPFPPDSAERLRKHLAHFSIVDSGRDPRDGMLWLSDLRRSPFYEAVHREIAELSSDVDRFGFGSTRKLLSAR